MIMNCETARLNIDQYFDEKIREMDLELSQHLKNCDDCNNYYDDCKKAGELVTHIRDFEPALSDPTNLTGDIMMGIEARSAKSEHDKKIIPFYVFQNVTFRRLLSAAAVILFFVFGYEQYLVLDKINCLEIQYQKVSESRNNMYNSWETSTLKKYNYIKTNNKELIKKINSMGNNVLLLKIASGYQDNNKFVPEELYRDLYTQKECSSLIKKFIEGRELLPKQK